MGFVGELVGHRHNGTAVMTLLERVLHGHSVVPSYSNIDSDREGARAITRVGGSELSKVRTAYASKECSEINCLISVHSPPTLGAFVPVSVQGASAGGLQLMAMRPLQHLLLRLIS